MDRRQWIRAAGLAGVAAAAPSPLSPSLSALTQRGAAPGPLGLPRARNLIFFALDGTGFEDLATASHFSERVLGRPFFFREFLRRGASSGAMFTHSLTAVVTDSAAASTAWSTGRKVVNGALCMYPDGRPLRPILDLAREAGRATGLATTTRITHATPAGWIARAADRDQEDDIALQYLEFQPEVLLGGGAAHFLARSRRDRRDLVAEFRARGYDVVRSRRELLNSAGDRILGLFTDGTSHVPYEIDRRFQGVDAPSLAEMAGAALARLQEAPRGFVLQVEAGRIDHANHENDPGGMIWEWMAADETLRLLVDFVDRTPGTLLFVAADHDTGGGTVYGFGDNYLSSTPALLTVQRQRMSLQRFRSRLGRNPDLALLPEAVREFLGFDPTPDQVERMGRVLKGEASFGHPTAHSGDLNSLAAVLWEIPKGRVDRPNLAFSTGNHTAGTVPVALYGTGLTPAPLGVVDNTQLFSWMLEALGLSFSNPEMSEAEALEILARRGEEGEPRFRHPFD